MTDQFNLFGFDAYQEAVDSARNETQENQIVSRIWDEDHTVWADSPDEISNRLGWLHSPTVMEAEVEGINALVDQVREAGFTHILLLGMGGSSLAPEVFRNIFGFTEGYLDLAVLDSTHPDTLRAFDDSLDLEKTLFIVATKSGGTVETLSFFKHFYNQVSEAVGKESAGEHFIAITDPGSKLVSLAEKYNFRETFINDPNIGGRYSVLSFFGLVPAGLVGVDLAQLLAQGKSAAKESKSKQNDIALQLGVIMATLADSGRDKLTFITSPGLATFGDWVEQLIAESVGKEGKGILPVVGETIGTPAQYSDDRLFVFLRILGDPTHVDQVQALEEAGYPVLHVPIDTLYGVGSQFFIWEMATAIAGHRMEIHPFNQPNVESAKIQARKVVAAYAESGELPAQEVSIMDGTISVYGGTSAENVPDALNDFIADSEAGAYIAIHAYLPPTQETTDKLKALQTYLRSLTKRAVTLGYAPRFLHSTGQLHKGDGGNGLFIQITSEPEADLPIPDEAGKSTSAMSFGVLIASQVIGDGQALIGAGRQVIRFHLGGDLDDDLDRLLAAVSESN